MPKLSAEDIIKKLEKHPGWELVDQAAAIEKKYIFKNFSDALCFLNRVAELAEESDHHPDLHLTGYKNLRIVLSTHSAGGITKKDFDMASQIRKLEDEITE